MSNVRRGVAATVTALAVVALLAGCGESQANSDNFGPVENVEYEPVNGMSYDSTIVKVRDVYLLADNGPTAPQLRMSLINTTTTNDALVGATIGTPAVTGRLVGGTAGRLPVNAGTSVLIGVEGGPQVTFPGVDLKPGSWVPITLLFANGKAVGGSVLVQNAVSEYSDGTLPTGRPVDLPTQQVLPSGNAEHGAAEEAQVQQGVDDHDQIAPENEEH